MMRPEIDCFVSAQDPCRRSAHRTRSMNSLGSTLQSNTALAAEILELAFGSYEFKRS